MATPSFETVCTWIRGRQSVYPTSFTGQKVSDELVLELLKNANTAPSHRHTEPWRFKVIRPESLTAFADFSQETYKAVHQVEVFKERKYNKLKTKILACSHILVLVMQRDEAASVPEWEEIAAVSCAVQNIYLSLSSAGLGGYWSSPLYLMEAINEYVSLEERETCYGFFYLGVPQEQLPPPTVKGSLESKVEWI